MHRHLAGTGRTLNLVDLKEGTSLEQNLTLSLMMRKLLNICAALALCRYDIPGVTLLSLRMIRLSTRAGSTGSSHEDGLHPLLL